MTKARPFRPRFSLPTTIIAENNIVHLISGEDVRYTIRAGAASSQLASLLERCDGHARLDDLLEKMVDKDLLQKFITRLATERVLMDGPAERAAVADNYRAVAEGQEPLAKRFLNDSAGGKPLAVLCQTDLNHAIAYQFNRRCLSAGNSPWLWITTGPASRGYVSPVFLPDAGPCLSCLLRQFQRLSPVPHLYDALKQHGENSGRFTNAEFPEDAEDVLERIARWKINQLKLPVPAPAVFRLHVLELATMEVQTHRVFPDPTCPECADARLV